MKMNIIIIYVGQRLCLLYRGAISKILAGGQFFPREILNASNILQNQHNGMICAPFDQKIYQQFAIKFSVLYNRDEYSKKVVF